MRPSRAIAVRRAITPATLVLALEQVATGRSPSSLCALLAAHAEVVFGDATQNVKRKPTRA